MELFNKYKNKNFTYLTNYINACISDESLALTPDELSVQLSGTSQSTFEEFIQAILNRADLDENNAALFYENKGKMLPLRNISVPIRATIAEKAWLYYVLQNSKADLFLHSGLKERLLDALSRDMDPGDYPLRPEYVDIRELSPENHLDITPELIDRFRTIVQAIRQHRKLTVTNHSYSGQVYSNQVVLPYKLEYSSQFDSFSLSCYPTEEKRPIKMNLSNISSVSLGEKIEQYEVFLTEYEKQLSALKVRQPVQIEILNQNDAYDRCAYLFSSFDTYCYDKGNDKLIMNIYYYRFQAEEIIRNILFLGHYVKVLSPKSIADEVVRAIKASYENYEQDNDQAAFRS
ncbi:MAG: WYL domain-containing protein [Lachnospiraceae bacterium]|nr:WYL domain-containing protein [Lachnospiraceae bacterium]